MPTNQLTNSNAINLPEKASNSKPSSREITPLDSLYKQETDRLDFEIQELKSKLQSRQRRPSSFNTVVRHTSSHKASISPVRDRSTGLFKDVVRPVDIKRSNGILDDVGHKFVNGTICANKSFKNTEVQCNIPAKDELHQTQLKKWKQDEMLQYLSHFEHWKLKAYHDLDQVKMPICHPERVYFQNGGIQNGAIQNGGKNNMPDFNGLIQTLKSKLEEIIECKLEAEFSKHVKRLEDVEQKLLMRNKTDGVCSNCLKLQDSHETLPNHQKTTSEIKRDTTPIKLEQMNQNVKSRRLNLKDSKYGFLPTRGTIEDYTGRSSPSTERSDSDPREFPQPRRRSNSLHQLPISTSSPKHSIQTDIYETYRRKQSLKHLREISERHLMKRLSSSSESIASIPQKIDLNKFNRETVIRKEETIDASSRKIEKNEEHGWNNLESNDKQYSKINDSLNTDINTGIPQKIDLSKFNEDVVIGGSKDRNKKDKIIEFGIDKKEINSVENDKINDTLDSKDSKAVINLIHDASNTFKRERRSNQPSIKNSVLNKEKCFDDDTELINDPENNDILSVNDELLTTEFKNFTNLKKIIRPSGVERVKQHVQSNRNFTTFENDIDDNESRTMIMSNNTAVFGNLTKQKNNSIIPKSDKLNNSDHFNTDYNFLVNSRFEENNLKMQLNQFVEDFSKSAIINAEIDRNNQNTTTENRTNSDYLKNTTDSPNNSELNRRINDSIESNLKNSPHKLNTLHFLENIDDSDSTIASNIQNTNKITVIADIEPLNYREELSSNDQSNKLEKSNELLPKTPTEIVKLDFSNIKVMQVNHGKSFSDDITLKSETKEYLLSSKEKEHHLSDRESSSSMKPRRLSSDTIESSSNGRNHQRSYQESSNKHNKPLKTKIYSTTNEYPPSNSENLLDSSNDQKHCTTNDEYLSKPALTVKVYHSSTSDSSLTSNRTNNGHKIIPRIDSRIENADSLKQNKFISLHQSGFENSGKSNSPKPSVSGFKKSPKSPLSRTETSLQVDSEAVVECRKVVKQVLGNLLERLGVDRNSESLTTDVLERQLAALKQNEKSIIKDCPNYYQIRANLLREIEDSADLKQTSWTFEQSDKSNLPLPPKILPKRLSLSTMSSDSSSSVLKSKQKPYDKDIKHSLRTLNKRHSFKKQSRKSNDNFKYLTNLKEGQNKDNFKQKIEDKFVVKYISPSELDSGNSGKETDPGSVEKLKVLSIMTDKDKVVDRSKMADRVPVPLKRTLIKKRTAFSRDLFKSDSLQDFSSGGDTSSVSSYAANSTIRDPKQNASIDRDKIGNLSHFTDENLESNPVRIANALKKFSHNITADEVLFTRSALRHVNNTNDIKKQVNFQD